MSDFPHVYTTTSTATNEVVLKVQSESLPDLDVTPPVEFGGPEGHWNPEAFFSAAISSCFILTFKSISRAKKLPWEKIVVDADAYLDKTGTKLSFTKVDIFVTLTIPGGADKAAYLEALEKAEASCLITNSINAKISLHPVVQS